MEEQFDELDELKQEYNRLIQQYRVMNARLERAKDNYLTACANMIKASNNYNLGATLYIACVIISIAFMILTSKP